MPASDRPTFSQSWARVNKLTPRLRPTVQIKRQLYRGEAWHIVYDPIAHNFFRLSPVGYYLVGLLDGQRTVDEVWRLTLERYQDDAPTQDETIGLLGQLNESNLLRVDLPADAEPLLKRSQKRTVRHWTGQAMSLLFVQIPLFNPDRMLNWLMPLFRPLFSRVGLVLWAVWMAVCLFRFVPHVGDFLSDAEGVLAPRNWGWMVVLFILTKAAHELAHGLMCKRFGGTVPEVGVMMLVLFPMPFVNATAAWNFPTKWRRLLVSAAGMMVELAIAGGAAIFWINAEAGVPKQIAYNLVFLASVSTLIFNGNPLLRFDGYYMLSDLLEVPNLYERSTRHLKWLVQKFAYGLKRAQPPSTQTYERTIFTIYGLASQIYRFFVLFGIILFVAGSLPSVGIILAGWSFIAWVCVPIGKFVHYLATSPMLVEQRGRAVAVTLLALALGLGLLGLVRVPEHRRMEGIVESTQQPEINVSTEGVIEAIHVTPGQRVEQGQLLLEMSNRELTTRLVQVRAQIRQLDALRSQLAVDDPAQLRNVETRLQTLEESLAVLQDRQNRLAVRSPRAGVLIAPELDQLRGRFLQQGQVVGRVDDLSALRVTALVDQSSNAELFRTVRIEDRAVELRSVGAKAIALPSTIDRVLASGRTSLPHPALGYRGGGAIATDTADGETERALHPQFELWIHVPDESELPDDLRSRAREIAFYPGQRVFVRMALPDRPLLAQWYDALRKTVRDRIML